MTVTTKMSSKMSSLHKATTTDIQQEIGSAVGTIRNFIKVAYAVSNNWKHHIMQHTCSESGAGEQVLLLYRILRSAASAKEELLSAAKQFSDVVFLQMAQEKRSNLEVPEMKTLEPEEEDELQGNHAKENGERQPLSDEEYLAWLIEESKDDDDEQVECVSMPEDKDEVASAKRKKLDHSEPTAKGKEDEPCISRAAQDQVAKIPGEAEMVSRDEDREWMEKELAELQHSYEYLPKRKIGVKARGCPSCTFCGLHDDHCSDSCPRIIDGMNRWNFILDENLCECCLKDCDLEQVCKTKSEQCWYCNNGHHRALCTISDEKPRIAARIEKIKRKLWERGRQQ
ncbi:hypothetical protein OSTOST_03272, partial [Ostertagia ostertagi]